MGEEQPWGHWGHWFGLERMVGMFFPVLLLFNKTFFFSILYWPPRACPFHQWGQSSLMAPAGTV